MLVLHWKPRAFTPREDRWSPKNNGGWTRKALELSQVNELLAKIKILMDEGVTESVGDVFLDR
jgi:hypothetical protein